MCVGKNCFWDSEDKKSDLPLPSIGTREYRRPQGEGEQPEGLSPAYPVFPGERRNGPWSDSFSYYLGTFRHFSSVDEVSFSVPPHSFQKRGVMQT